MFTHLHVHTEYSLLDGMCRISQLVARAKELGMTALAITDHGVMHGIIEFYHACKQAGIKPIIGCEVYVAQGSRLNHANGDKNNHHLVLLARDQTGYQNLIQLTTKAHLEGFYYKPRVDKDLLREHHQGLVALTACIGGEIPQLILNGRYLEAKQAALEYQAIFPDFYLEIQKHPMPELKQINQGLLKIHQETGIPLVLTNDVHYINKEDAPAHDLLLCIGTNSVQSDANRAKKMAGDFFYLKTSEEMEQACADLPDAFANTQRIADMCNLQLEFGRLHLPEIGLPPGKTPDEYLADLCRESFPRFYPEATTEIKQRLEYELDVIKKTEFANYFLVVWDIARFVHESKILFGVRGSAAASIVLHCLGITEIDPIEHKLVFERFLNIERKEMPDIDMDFQDDRRDEVIKYVSGKYGQDHVAQIITFGTLGAKAAIRDVGRALGLAYPEVDRVAKLIPNVLNMTLERALKENPELKSIYDQDRIVRHLVDSAMKVEGLARHASTHAAGVVIARDKLTKYVPLQKASRDGEELVMTQFAMGDIARIGLLKMDFLGLANLTILGKAREIIKRTRGVEIDLYRLPMDDQKTFDLLKAAHTSGVFQLEGSGMRRYVKDLQPTTFGDIAAMIALYRPGPMEHIPTFIDAKHGKKPIVYPHPTLEPILHDTYGVIVYQDQVLFIVRAFAGYSLGQADIFRKAMGKKIPEVMQKEKANFLAGAQKLGYSEAAAAAVFALIEPFAGYAFNKAHSVSYALIAYQTAYLKANFPAEYVTAFMSAQLGQPEKIATSVSECRRLGITVLPPDINRSQVGFSIEKDDGGEAAVRFGLTAIKNVGEGAVTPVIAARAKKGLFKSIEDLCRDGEVHSINRRVMESLIKAGALDCLGDRGTLLNNVARILAYAQREQKMRETGQATLFNFGDSGPLPGPGLDLEPGEASPREKLAWEKELLGVSLSEKAFVPAGTAFCGEIDAEMDGQLKTIAGRVESISQLLTRDKKAFISATLRDVSGELEVMVWPKVYAETADLWQAGNELLVEGKVRVKDDRVQMVCDAVRPYEAPQEKEAREATSPTPVAAPALPRSRLTITINATGDSQDMEILQQLLDLLKSAPGSAEVHIVLTGDGQSRRFRLRLKVSPTTELIGRVEEVVGKGNVVVEVP